MQTLFRPRPTGTTPRFGIEAEVIPVTAEGRVCPIEPDPRWPGRPATGPLLRELAAELGWRVAPSPAGSPGFSLPHGGALSFEPGGQLEYSSPPVAGLDDVLAGVEVVLGHLARRARARGIFLVARGMDPVNEVAGAPLLLDAARYRRMAAHYDRRGLAGRRMMRQTAALHLNLDLGADPLRRWRVANRMVPALTALFANSPRAAGVETGHRSTRALQWRRLDPSRTGVRGGEGDPPSDYLTFALEADAFLLGAEQEPARPFRAWLGEGIDERDFLAHLSTLFPEVRPRGYLELRCFDALPLAWYGAPLAAAAGVLHSDEALDVLEREAPPVTPALLERAGRLGLADEGIRRTATLVLDLAEAGLARDPGAIGGCRALECLRAFRQRFSDTGLDHGHDATDHLTAE